MNFKIINKKIFISIIVILIFISGGVFLWWDKIENYLERKEMEIVIAPSKDYIIQETSTGKFVENEKDGFKVQVPEGWEVEIGMDIGGYVSERKVTLYSSDFSYRPPQGCLIEIQISRLKEEKEGFLVKGADEVREMIEYYKERETEVEESSFREVILVDKHEALKRTKVLKGEIGKHISIEIPVENRVYSFEFVLFSERCDQEFDRLLETVSID